MIPARSNAVHRGACLRALAAIGLLTLSLAGCANPNFIGVQDFGYIVGNVVDQNGKPVANAFVTSTGASGAASVSTGPNGGFTIQNVAVGEQQVTVTPPAGYAAPAGGPVTVIVVKNQGVSAGNIVIQNVLPAT
jgi:hypothetical protein